MLCVMLLDYAFSCRACLAAFLAVVTCLCMLERLFNPSMPLQAQATQQQSAESDTSLPITGAMPHVEARVAALQSEQQQHRKRSNRYRGTRGGARRCVC